MKNIDRAADIEKLSQREAALLRPQMYIGNTSTYDKSEWAIVKEQEGFFLRCLNSPHNDAFFKMFDELISNSIGEYIKTGGKYGDKIDVWVKDVGWFVVKDNGRGVPTDVDPKHGVTKVELAFTELHAGSNFKENDDSPGMNGVGASLVCIFSKRFSVTTDDGHGRIYLECLDNLQTKTVKKSKSTQRGTTVEAELDLSRFEGLEAVTKERMKFWVYKRLLEIKTCFPAIKLTFNDERVEGVLYDMLDAHGTLQKKQGFHIGAFLKRDSADKDISFVNGIDSYEGGSHLDYVKRVVLDEVQKKLERKHKVELPRTMLRDSLFFIVNVIGFRDAKFHSQNKTRLISPESRVKEHIPEEDVNALIRAFMNQNEKELDEMVERLNEAHQLKLMRNAKPPKTRKDTIENFVDANSRDRSGTTLFITEGLSAKASFLRVRDQQKHGIFPLRGKVLNVYETPLKKVVSNEVIMNLVQVLGLQFGKEPSELYFDRVCILTDADPDGDSITSALIIFFYKFWPQLFDEKRIVKVLCPIVIATKGKEIKRFYTLEDYNREMNDLAGWSIKYYKGLGSLSSEEYDRIINNNESLELEVFDRDKTKKVLEVLFGQDTSIRKRWLEGLDILEGEHE